MPDAACSDRASVTWLDTRLADLTSPQFTTALRFWPIQGRRRLCSWPAGSRSFAERSVPARRFARGPARAGTHLAAEQLRKVDLRIPNLFCNCKLFATSYSPSAMGQERRMTAESM